MADPKKKKAKTKKSDKKSKDFTWTPKRTKAAQLLSTGIYLHKEVAEEVGVRCETISEWKQSQEFLDKIDELTFKNEWAMRAGLVRLGNKGISANLPNLVDDKNTALDWAKFVVDIIPQDTKESDDKLKELTDAIMASARK